MQRISKDEIRAAMKRMKSPDNLPVEVRSGLSAQIVQHDPGAWEDAWGCVLVPLFKNKGDVQRRSN